MSDLRVTTYALPAAGLGEENPLPPLLALPGVAAPTLTPDDPEPDLAYVGWGCDVGLLPYRVQDGYDRDKQPREFVAVVLENEHLTATFLPEIGGRLWSLVHRASGRELLYANPVFQPANLAVRNAWFSGGVEWNCSIPGHTPLTCAPLFAATLQQADGTPVYRQYEWERLRGVTYQVDAWLPDGSAVLYVAVRYVNPHDHEVPAYWWSNIAVPEAPDVRVLTPAEEAFRNVYSGGFDTVPIPLCEGRDRSYPAREPHATDYFYRVPLDRRPWIAALDGAGRGLFQTSTARLKGRKLFVWGQGPGGRRWQEFLSVPQRPYIEIQAGLARTQGACLPMPAHAQWTWVEAYGMVQTDPTVVHGEDWRAAQAEVEARGSVMAPDALLADAAGRAAATFDVVPAEHVLLGSGWAALERRRRRADQAPTADLPGLPFPDASLGPDQEPWLALLANGVLPPSPPTAPPGAWLTQPEWCERLAVSVAGAGWDDWRTWLHLGVAQFAAGEPAEARKSWTRSARLEANPVALRNLAVCAAGDGHAEAAAGYYRQACELAPECVPLVVEALTSFLDHQRPREAAALLARLSGAVRAHGRVALLEARAALDTGELARAEAILLGGIVVPDIREGEVSLSDLWYRLQAQRRAAAEGGECTAELLARVRAECPPPAELDFRMEAS